MPFTLALAKTAAQRLVGDDTTNIWSNSDLVGYINEAIVIIRGTIPEYFTSLSEVANDTDIITIDADYKYLIPLFASARMFEQDEQSFRGVQKLNEFETRRALMKSDIESSKAYSDKLDQDGTNNIDYVIDSYYN